LERAPSNVIAVLDDEVGVRTGLTRLLRSAGFEAIAFAEGAEFLDSLREEHPDCLILDLRMPRMDGFEVLDRLSEFEQTVPVIILTSFPSDETRRRALEAGVVAFLDKPVERPVLLDAIERALTIDHRPATTKNPDNPGPDPRTKESIP
jgi:two-component system response regulator FixJ